MTEPNQQSAGRRPSTGRRKGSISIRVRATEHLQTAINALAEIAADGAAPAVARVSAATALLDAANRPARRPNGDQS